MMIVSLKSQIRRLDALVYEQVLTVSGENDSAKLKNIALG